MWLDATVSDAGYLPDFLQWYERWLESALAGGKGTWWLQPEAQSQA
jgi:hypothetical protein